jgi:phosphohistidine phosphatase
LDVKTVYLLRHAKSSWDDPTLPDFSRPLNPRGRKAAPRVGHYMARQGLMPHRILCSGARRAVETMERVTQALDPDIPVEIRDDIYHSSTDTLLQLIQSQPQEVDSVLLIGHNPTFEDLALALAGQGDERALESLDRKYPTGALAILDFSVVQWKEVRGGTGFLRDFVRPKDLK